MEMELCRLSFTGEEELIIFLIYFNYFHEIQRTSYYNLSFLNLSDSDLKIALKIRIG